MGLVEAKKNSNLVFIQSTRALTSMGNLRPKCIYIILPQRQFRVAGSHLNQHPENDYVRIDDGRHSQKAKVSLGHIYRTWGHLQTNWRLTGQKEAHLRWKTVNQYTRTPVQSNTGAKSNTFMLQKLDTYSTWDDWSGGVKRDGSGYGRG